MPIKLIATKANLSFNPQMIIGKRQVAMPSTVTPGTQNGPSSSARCSSISAPRSSFSVRCNSISVSRNSCSASRNRCSVCCNRCSLWRNDISGSRDGSSVSRHNSSVSRNCHSGRRKCGWGSCKRIQERCERGRGSREQRRKCRKIVLATKKWKWGQINATLVLTFDTARPRFADRSQLPFQLERHGRQRRQMNQDRMFAGHPRNILAADAAVVSHVAAAIRLGIGVDDLTPESGLGHTEPVIVAHQRRGVHYERNHLAVARLAQKRNDRVLGAGKIGPTKTSIGDVELAEPRFAFVNVVQMLR